MRRLRRTLWRAVRIDERLHEARRWHLRDQRQRPGQSVYRRADQVPLADDDRSQAAARACNFLPIGAPCRSGTCLS
jgi:hypothetical protein